MKATPELLAEALRIPEMMKAAAIAKFGSASALHTYSLPVPEPAANQILVAIHSAGVGVWDIAVRDGSWQPEGYRPFPIIVGTDGVGVVVKMGDQVTGFAVGDLVYGYGFSGFYAEYAVIDANRVGHVPEHMSLAEAAAASVPGLTTLQGLEHVLNLNPANTLLIFGASGSMGTLAVQFAKARRLRVVATGSGSEAQRLLLKLGADMVVDARNLQGVQELREFAPNGVDGAFVLGGGPLLEEYLDSVKDGGQIVFPYGVEPAPRRRDQARVAGYNLEAGALEMSIMTKRAAEISLQAPIAAVFTLGEAAKAHERLEEGHILGRIILRTKFGMSQAEIVAEGAD